MDSQDQNVEEAPDENEENDVTIGRLILRGAGMEDAPPEQKPRGGKGGKLRLDSSRPKEMDLKGRGSEEVQESTKSQKLVQQNIPRSITRPKALSKGRKFKNTDTGQIPSILTRVLATLFSFGFLYTYLPIIAGKEILPNLAKKLLGILNEHTAEIMAQMSFIAPELLSEMIVLIVLWSIFDLAVSLLLSVPFGLFLMGYLEGSGFILGRIKVFFSQS